MVEFREEQLDMWGASVGVGGGEHKALDGPEVGSGVSGWSG